MPPLSQSSGNPAHDRRLEWARAYLADGEAATAAAMLEDLTQEASRFAAAWFLLAEARETLDDPEGAAHAYEAVLACDRDDRLGAGVRLARLGRRQAEGALSAAFVQDLFDQYAPRFDKALRDGLAYRGPELLLEAIRAIDGRERFARLIDLGCGTGLAAPVFAPLCADMAGVDISPGMVREAEALGLYARLDVADMADFLRRAPPGSADLVIAADALCYVDDLAPVFAQGRRVLEAGGLLAFTVETHEGAGLILRDTLRYAHGAPLVRGALEGAGFTVRLLRAASTRTEKGAPVAGLVCVAS